MTISNLKLKEIKKRKNTPKAHLTDQFDNSCCDSIKLVEEGGYIVCLNCGCVYVPVYDESPRRVFTPEEIRKKKKTEPKYSVIGPRTVMRGQKDAKGKLLSPKIKARFKRLSKIHRSLYTSYERNLWIALPNLYRIEKALRLPNQVAEDALRIYTYAVREKMTMGRSIDVLLSASIYASVRVHGVARTINEIAKVSQISKKKINRSYKLIFMEVLPELDLKVQQISPERYVDKFYEELGLSMKVRNFSIELIQQAKENGFFIAGKDPKGISIAAIYMVAKRLGEQRTQKELANLSNITEVTIRTRCKELKRFANPISILRKLRDVNKY